MSNQKLILLGGGGHCRSVLDVIFYNGESQIAGILDVEEKIGEEVLGVPIIATEDEIGKLALSGHAFVICIGQIKSPNVRQRIYANCLEHGATVVSIVSKRAHVSSHSQVGQGCTVMHDALINAKASVGINCIINTKAILEHDVQVGDHCHIGPGAVLNGGCEIGDGTFIGSSATVMQGVKIGPGVVVGAGSVVTKDILDGGTWAGVPAVKIQA